ncbi:MAG: ABC transporter ATP-binding protein, partial [Clostridia bacterium]|nr:ABC transporter ATP-binding protein [Clostridia bacterium]
MMDLDEKEKLKGDHKIPLHTLLKRTLQYVRSAKWHFLLAAFLILINVGMDVIIPLFTARITDELTAPVIEFRTILILVIAYLVISLVNNGFLYVESMVLQKAGQKIIFDLRMDIFSHIESMSQNQFSEMPVGSLVTRVTSYTQSLSDLFTNVIVSVIRNFLTIFGVYAIMFTISVKLSLILLIPVTVIFVTSVIFSKVVGKIFREERANVSELNAFLNENLSGMKITQIFNQEKRKDREFCQKNEKLRKSHFKVILAFGIYRPLVTFVYVGTIALIFKFGVEAGLSPGDIVAFYLYSGRFFNPVQQLADQLNN